jgi:hypothetical protein
VATSAAPLRGGAEAGGRSVDRRPTPRGGASQQARLLMLPRDLGRLAKPIAKYCSGRLPAVRDREQSAPASPTKARVGRLVPRTRRSSTANVSRLANETVVCRPEAEVRDRRRRAQRPDRGCAGAASGPRRHVGRDAVSFEHYDELTTDDKGFSPSAGGRKVAWFKDPDGNTFAVEGTADSSLAPSQGGRIRPPSAERRAA